MVRDPARGSRLLKRKGRRAGEIGLTSAFTMVVAMQIRDFLYNNENVKYLRLAQAVAGFALDWFLLVSYLGILQPKARARIPLHFILKTLLYLL